MYFSTRRQSYFSKEEQPKLAANFTLWPGCAQRHIGERIKGGVIVAQACALLALHPQRTATAGARVVMLPHGSLARRGCEDSTACWPEMQRIGKHGRLVKVGTGCGAPVGNREPAITRESDT